ncbi:ceramidase domain-containing protein [Methylomonas rivi]|uniref:Ceramidase n=1 Tax=Methylomonas rivi TaxID=2952226 RepID=A0ABT1U8D4_9GAMM|nr:ceramidase domain-containing protein [Methylomonas sp. WSC-6]MCQ8130104.1 ceramidase [Methylomonas sp. WSC-6]
MDLYEKRIGMLGVLGVAAVVTLFFVEPIAQDPNYHRFADARPLFGLANFWNVVSNLPFLAVGALGLYRCRRLVQPASGEAYRVMCWSVLLVGFGSAYYHADPTNATLLWDRLPMTVAFMALFSLLLGERVLPSQNRYRLWLLVAAGVASAFYWSWTESLGRGDLRPYLLVQFLPILLMPFMLLMFPERYLSNRLLLAAFALYFTAKLLEHFDGRIFSMLGFMGGHAIKHVAAAAAALCIIYAVPARRANVSKSQGNPCH